MENRVFVPLSMDQGKVLGSVSSDDFNAIDPNILADGDASVWLTCGSDWGGIKRRQIDPAADLAQPLGLRFNLDADR
jgi:arabinan endo-1,5-alpha-L-arabinosidase